MDILKIFFHKNKKDNFFNKLNTNKYYLTEIKNLMEQGKKTKNVINGKTEVTYELISNKKINKIYPSESISFKKTEGTNLSDIGAIPNKCLFCKQEIKDSSKLKLYEFNNLWDAGPLALHMRRGICAFCNKCNKPIALKVNSTLMS